MQHFAISLRVWDAICGSICQLCFPDPLSQHTKVWILTVTFRIFEVGEGLGWVWGFQWPLGWLHAALEAWGRLENLILARTRGSILSSIVFSNSIEVYIGKTVYSLSAWGWGHRPPLAIHGKILLVSCMQADVVRASGLHAVCGNRRFQALSHFLISSLVDIGRLHPP